MKRVLYLKSAINKRNACLFWGHWLPGDEKSEVKIHIQTCSNRTTSVRQSAWRDRRLQSPTLTPFGPLVTQTFPCKTKLLMASGLDLSHRPRVWGPQ